MDSGKKEKIYCDDDGECLVCNELAIDRYYNNHPKSQTRMNFFRKKQELNKNNSTTFSTTNNALDFEKFVAFN